MSLLMKIKVDAADIVQQMVKTDRRVERWTDKRNWCTLQESYSSCITFCCSWASL